MLNSSERNGFNHPLASEITPLTVFRERRTVLKRLGLAGATVAGLGADLTRAQSMAYQRPGKNPALAHSASQVPGAFTMDKPTSYEDASSYNNFYEFGTDKSDPARHAHALKTAPWAIEVQGLVAKPRRFDIDDLLRLSAQEERIYRLRCVEGWSMVIPWLGYSLSALIRQVQPLGSAKYVAFVSQADRATMPGVRSSVLDWPYVEGLRLDEAMHPLTLLTFGMYGELLPKQSGAPVRLVVPWKYGFKSAKSLVAIRFTEQQPETAWNKAIPQEYGFYSNVNPEVDHPRWSQASERRIGAGGLFAPRRKTLLFNGYEAQVGQLYAGMDLKRNF